MNSQLQFAESFGFANKLQKFAESFLLYEQTSKICRKFRFCEPILVSELLNPIFVPLLLQATITTAEMDSLDRSPHYMC